MSTFYIQARGFTVTQALGSFVRQRLNRVMKIGQDRIQRIAVRLTDVNGPKGGEDKCCQVQVVLAGQPDVVIRDTRADLYEAVDRAASRARRTLRRRIGQRRARRRAEPAVEDQ